MRLRVLLWGSDDAVCYEQALAEGAHAPGHWCVTHRRANALAATRASSATWRQPAQPLTAAKRPLTVRLEVRVMCPLARVLQV